jgi:hypothetical protein
MKRIACNRLQKKLKNYRPTGRRNQRRLLRRLLTCGTGMGQQVAHLPAQ